MSKWCNDHFTYSANRDTKMGALGILQVIDEGVFIYKCKVFPDITPKITWICLWQSFLQKEMSECCGGIIDNKSHALVFELEEKDRKTAVPKNVLRFSFKKICIMESF